MNHFEYPSWYDWDGVEPIYLLADCLDDTDTQIQIQANPSRYEQGMYSGFTQINNFNSDCAMSLDYDWSETAYTRSVDEIWNSFEYYWSNIRRGVGQTNNDVVLQDELESENIKTIPFDDKKHKKFKEDIYDSMYSRGVTSDNLTKTKSGDIIGGEGGGHSLRNDWYQDKETSDELLYRTSDIHSSNHGTAVAGIIAARTVYDENPMWDSYRENSMAGLCSTCKIVPLTKPSLIAF